MKLENTSTYLDFKELRLLYNRKREVELCYHDLRALPFQQVVPINAYCYKSIW